MTTKHLDSALAQAWAQRDFAKRRWEAAKRGDRGAAAKPYEDLVEAERALDALRAEQRVRLDMQRPRRTRRPID